MDKEMAMLEGMGTWKKEMLLEDQKVIRCYWVYTKKRDENSQIIKYKAHLVVQGFSQKPGINYSKDRMFAPVMWFKTLCTVLAHATVHNLKLHQFNVKGTYLHGHLEEEIYMVQLPGNNDGSGKVCALLQLLYGLT